MDQKIESFFRRQWYPYLYGLAFLLFKTVRYTPSFSWPVAFNLFVLYIAITWLLLEAFKKTATVAYAGVFVIICWVSLLHVVGIAQWLGFEYAYIPAWFYYAFYVLVLCCLIAARYLLRKCKKKLCAIPEFIAEYFFADHLPGVCGERLGNSRAREEGACQSRASCH